MPYKIRARSGGKLVLVRQSGHVDCQEVTDVMSEIERLRDPDNPPRLLIDVRSADSFPTNEELINWFYQHPPIALAIKRLALVTGTAHAETIKAIAEGHEARGTPVRIFDDELEALTWVMRARQSTSVRGSEVAFQELASVRLYVSDIARARAFYADMLGLAPLEYAGPENQMQFKLANASVIVTAVDPEDERFHALVGRATGISFRVIDMDDAYERLSSRGVKFCGEPERHDGGEQLVDFLDPDNNVLTFIS